MRTQHSTVASPGGATRGTGGPDGQRDTTEAPAHVSPTGVVSTRASGAWVKVLPALLTLASIRIRRLGKMTRRSSCRAQAHQHEIDTL